MELKLYDASKDEEFILDTDKVEKLAERLSNFRQEMSFGKIETHWPDNHDHYKNEYLKELKGLSEVYNSHFFHCLVCLSMGELFFHKETMTPALYEKLMKDIQNFRRIED